MIQFSKNRLFICLIFWGVISLWGCTNTPIPPWTVDGIQPLWSFKLPGKAGVYNDGLIGLPIYNGKILFHSTNFTNIVDGKFEEDNRVNALDSSTGELQWKFPLDYSKTNSMFFGAVPYILDEYLVTKMPASGIFQETDKVLCFNMSSQQEIWQKIMPKSLSLNTSIDVVGNANLFYFIQETKKETLIYEGNIMTGDTTMIYRIKAAAPYNKVEISSDPLFYNSKDGKPQLIFGTVEEIENNSSSDFKTYCCIFDIQSRLIKYKTLIPRNDDYLLGHFKMMDNRVYMTCGRTSTCLDPNTGGIIWQYFSEGYVNYATPRLSVSDGVVFLNGDNRYIGLDALTGKKLYQGDTQCANGDSFNGYMYIIGRDEYLYIVNIHTGKITAKITCPEKNPKSGGGGFHIGCKPQVHGDKLYVFSYTSAYCYKATP
ncbi:MAG: PQQ-binding-like beta-propeller repeat protein [Paludibacter sp.]|nr:PQQ-binding-like beta-propeller repeat protein [Paludibacter sp.]